MNICIETSITTAWVHRRSCFKMLGYDSPPMQVCRNPWESFGIIFKDLKRESSCCSSCICTLGFVLRKRVRKYLYSPDNRRKRRKEEEAAPFTQHPYASMYVRLYTPHLHPVKYTNLYPSVPVHGMFTSSPMNSHTEGQTAVTGE